MSRFNFTTPVTRPRAAARIEALVIHPQRPAVEVTVSFGVNDGSGNYVEEENSRVTHMIEPADLGAAARTEIAAFITRAFQFLRARGIIPAGTEG